MIVIDMNIQTMGKFNQSQMARSWKKLAEIREVSGRKYFLWILGVMFCLTQWTESNEKPIQLRNGKIKFWKGLGNCQPIGLHSQQCDYEAVLIEEDTVLSERLSSGKSKIYDDKPAEVFKYGWYVPFHLMAKMFLSMFKFDFFPAQLMKVLLVYIVKGKSMNTSLTANYRPIAITTVASMFLETINQQRTQCSSVNITEHLSKICKRLWYCIEPRENQIHGVSTTCGFLV